MSRLAKAERCQLPDAEPIVFQPKKILIVSKLSRYEFERKTHVDLPTKDLQKELKERGLAVSDLLHRQESHEKYLKAICSELEKRGVATRVIQFWNVCSTQFQWGDAILTAGGDGTFLMAAARINGTRKPVIGVCTQDHDKPEYGHRPSTLCWCSGLDALGSMFDRLFAGDFEWKWRQRIRITLTGSPVAKQPIEFSDRNLMYPECNLAHQNRSRLRNLFSGSPGLWLSPLKNQGQNGNCRFRFRSVDSQGPQPVVQVLKQLALNEVYIGDTASARTSYYEISVDGSEFLRQKSSGLTISTGTGSSSWHFSGNQISPQFVQQIGRLVNEECCVNLPVDSDAFLQAITNQYNAALIYDPSDTRMAYSIRDLVKNDTFPAFNSRGFSSSAIRVLSRSSGGMLTIDGAVSYIFEHGCEAKLEINPADAIRTIVLN